MNIKKMNRIEAFKMVSNNLKEDHISESSAQCAYYVILSFIPFLILLITLIQYINVDPQQLFDIVSHILPDNIKDLVLGIIEEAYSKSFGTISISIIFTLFSADKGLFALTKGLHKIYNFSDHKDKPWIYLKLMSIVHTALFIILIAVGLVVMVFDKTIIATIQENLGVLEHYSWFSELMAQVEMLLISFVLFLCVYKFMSRHKLNILKQVRGAAFAALALNIVSYVFSKYLQIFRGFSTTYGSLTALILIMMWTYTVFYIIFLGAEINKFYYIENEKKQESK